MCNYVVNILKNIQRGLKDIQRGWKCVAISTCSWLYLITSPTVQDSDEIISIVIEYDCTPLGPAFNGKVDMYEEIKDRIATEIRTNSFYV